MSLQGGFYRIGPKQIQELPIALPKDKEVINKLEEYVDRIQYINNSEETDSDNVELDELSQCIDDMVFELYGLTEEEKKNVMKQLSKSNK